MRPSKSLSLRIATLALTAWVAAMDAASAQETARTYQIAEQSLGQALREFALTSNLDLLFSPDLVSGKKSPSLDGKFTVDEGLRTLLRGSGLEFSVSGSRVVISEEKAGPARQATSSTSTLKGTNGYTRLAQAERESSVLSTAQDTGAAALREEDHISLEEIVVVGSRLGASVTESAQPVKIITLEEIERSGATNIAQVLNNLPEVSINSSGTSVQNNFGSTTVRLRGLPTGTVLVLVNGRRSASTGTQTESGFFDLSTIPLGAVERIEVLPNGSSAVYGGDALGGVVNVVLKKSIEGVAANVRYGGAEGYDETQSSLGWGHTWARGAVSVVGTYSRNNELRGLERSITSDYDFRAFGGVNRTTTQSNPGNVYSLTSQNLPGLNSTFAAVPDGSTGIGMTPADFEATAGTLNRGSPHAYRSFLVPQERYSALMYGSFDLGSSIELYSEFLYSDSEVEEAVTFPILSRRRVPASNPFNPFGVPVAVDYMFTGAERRCNCFSVEYLRPLLGVKGDIGSWDWDIATWISRDKRENVQTGVVDSAAVNAALASTDPATALNVFQDGPAGSPALLDSLLTTQTQRYRGGMEAANAFLRGPVAQLPTGTANVLIGAEYEKIFFKYLIGNPAGVDEDRETYALFGEARVPLWPSNVRDDVLVFSGAVRYDHYSDFGSEVSVGSGLEFRPVKSLLLRASYSSAFKPAPLFQLYSPLGFLPGTPITDPQLGGVTYPVTVAAGGNPSLEPETGWSKTIGAIFSPRENLDVSLTYWVLRLENGFVLPAPQDIVNNSDLFPGRVTRDATGQITLVDFSYVNFGILDEAGIDFAVSWQHDTPIGRFSPSLAITNTHNYELQETVNGPHLDNVSKANPTGFAPRWKGTASLGWKENALQATVTTRYVSDYRDYAPLADGRFQELGDYWYVDANLRYELSRYLPGAHLSIGAVNVLDELPEFSNNSTHGFDPRTADLRGRFWYAELGVNF